MATPKKIAAPAAEASAAEAPKMVQLKCDKLGVKSQDFTPGHAKDLLAFQESKGLKPEDCWQRVDETPTPTE